MDASMHVVGLAALSVGSIAAGGLTASKWTPSTTATSVLLYTTAGLTLASAANEMIPPVLNANTWSAHFFALVGIISAITLLFGIRFIFPPLAPQQDALGGDSPHKSPLPVALMTSVVMNVLIESTLVGTVVASGRTTNFMLGVALVVGNFLLTLATSERMRLRDVRSVVQYKFAALLALTSAAGIAIGYVGGARRWPLSVSQAIMGFGMTGMLWLILFELLPDASLTSRTHDAVLAGPLAFFGAFSGSYLMDWLGGRPPCQCT